MKKKTIRSRKSSLLVVSAEFAKSLHRYMFLSLSFIWHRNLHRCFQNTLYLFMVFLEVRAKFHFATAIASLMQYFARRLPELLLAVLPGNFARSCVCARGCVCTSVRGGGHGTPVRIHSNIWAFFESDGFAPRGPSYCTYISLAEEGNARERGRIICR